ncbi:hypothetical protein K4F52_002329 [Lecanicillium sp. MT-2017a]|nr:hypothetical protein K4F52_002329 [Lecanicillium sp. MT-2017a]
MVIFNASGRCLTQANNIAVRKLTEESQLGAQSMQKLTEQSLADARHMKHLAYLNMAFLPSAVIAAIFSTPFLALDDQLSFRAISRIWVLLLVCVACTALTFAMSWLLGLSNGKTPSPNADADTAAEDTVPEADRAMLNRPPQPNLEAELINWDDVDKRAKEMIHAAKIHAAAGNGRGAETEEDSDSEEDIYE